VVEIGEALNLVRIDTVASVAMIVIMFESDADEMQNGAAERSVFCCCLRADTVTQRGRESDRCRGGPL
jgi:hypothetical protein